MTNKEIAEFFLELASTLETEGDNPYRIRAYRRAAREIAYQPRQLDELVAENADLTAIPHIGKAIADNIKELIRNGKLSKRKTAKPFKKAGDELKYIKWLGPKRIKILRDNLNITTKSALIEAMAAGTLLALPGFSEKIINKIVMHLHEPKRVLHKLKLYHAISIVEKLLQTIRQVQGVKRAEAVGDYRRRVELVSDIGIILELENQDILKQILEIDAIKSILTATNNCTTVILHSGLQIKLYYVQASDYGANLFYLTGSAAHIEELEKINHHKAFKGTTETEIYKSLKMDYVAPELRENRGEVLAARQNKLPKLINLDDIKGDLHCHTWETDGTESLEMMVKSAMAKGYEYVAITDHSKRLAITNGLDEKRLLEQIKLIDQLNEKLTNFTVLKAIEVDILEDGSLDISNDVLKELDLCVCSIHSKFKLPEKQQTERIIRAMDNPYFTILGHATGRLLNFREPYQINIERILNAAKERHCFIELNAQPARLDIHDNYCLLAKQLGVKLAISSDAHSSRELNFMQLGIYQARRGWLEAQDVINTRSLKDFIQLIKR